MKSFWGCNYSPQTAGEHTRWLSKNSLNSTHFTIQKQRERYSSFQNMSLNKTKKESELRTGIYDAVYMMLLQVELKVLKEDQLKLIRTCYKDDDVSVV